MMPETMPAEVTLVGECNPYGGGDDYALFPSPDGCSGHRLCCTVLRMSRAAYLDCFVRVNLCVGRWSMPLAVERARRLRRDAGRLILCGAKVARAFMVAYEPVSVVESRLLVIPHPSGMCRAWNDPATALRVRLAMSSFYPEISDLIGVR